MLDKLAQIAKVRESEVRGCLAAFQDAGILKTASAEDFDTLTHAVASNLGIDYDIDTIYKTAAFILGGPVEEAQPAQEAPAQEKVADDKTAADETARMAAIGELFMKKVAGSIDDDTFTKELAPLMKKAEEEVGTEKKCDCGKPDCPICSKKDPEDNGKVNGGPCTC